MQDDPTNESNWIQRFTLETGLGKRTPTHFVASWMPPLINVSKHTENPFATAIFLLRDPNYVTTTIAAIEPCPIECLLHLRQEGATDFPLTKNRGTMPSNPTSFGLTFGGPTSPHYRISLLLKLSQRMARLLHQELFVLHFPLFFLSRWCCGF